MSNTLPLNRLKCAYCDWVTPLWTRKKGKKAEMSGWNRLEYHVEEQHPCIYDWLEEQRKTDHD